MEHLFWQNHRTLVICVLLISNLWYFPLAARNLLTSLSYIETITVMEHLFWQNHRTLVILFVILFVLLVSKPQYFPLAARNLLSSLSDIKTITVMEHLFWQNHRTLVIFFVLLVSNLRYFPLAARNLLSSLYDIKTIQITAFDVTVIEHLLPKGARCSSLVRAFAHGEIDLTTHHTMSERSYHGATSRSSTQVIQF